MTPVLLNLLLFSLAIFVQCQNNLLSYEIENDYNLQEKLSQTEGQEYSLISIVHEIAIKNENNFEIEQKLFNAEELEYSTSQPSSQPTSQPTGRPSSEPTSQPTKSVPKNFGSWAPAVSVEAMVFTVTQPVNGIDCDLLPLPADDLSALLNAVVATIKVSRSDIVNLKVECIQLKVRRVLGSSFQPYLTYGVVVQNSQNFTNVVSNIVTTAQNGQLQQNILAAAQAQNITALLQVTVPPTPPQLSPLVQASSPSPSVTPSDLPSIVPSNQPSVAPSSNPSSDNPSGFPSVSPIVSPSNPSVSPLTNPSTSPSVRPSVLPSNIPSEAPSSNPSVVPSTNPSTAPSVSPSVEPSNKPSVLPSSNPSVLPSTNPSTAPSLSPSLVPSNYPSFIPSVSPSISPSKLPSLLPSFFPSNRPSTAPQSPSTIFSNGVVGPAEVSIVVVGTIVFAALFCAVGYFAFLCNWKRRKIEESELDFGKMYADTSDILPVFPDKARPDSPRHIDSNEPNTTPTQKFFSSVDSLESGDVYKSKVYPVIPPSPTA